MFRLLYQNLAFWVHILKNIFSSIHISCNLTFSIMFPSSVFLFLKNFSSLQNIYNNSILSFRVFSIQCFHFPSIFRTMYFLSWIYCTSVYFPLRFFFSYTDFCRDFFSHERVSPQNRPQSYSIFLQYFYHRTFSFKIQSLISFCFFLPLPPD